MSIVVFDIDGTLADTSHRQHLNPRYWVGQKGKKPSWDDFHAAHVDDTSVLSVAVLHARLRLRASNEVIYVTGRNEAFRESTAMWMSRHAFNGEIIMRPDNDYRPNWEFKLDALNEIWARYTAVPMLWVDDNASVQEHLEPAGVPVLLVPENGGRYSGRVPIRPAGVTS